MFMCGLDNWERFRRDGLDHLTVRADQLYIPLGLIRLVSRKFDLAHVETRCKVGRQTERVEVSPELKPSKLKSIRQEDPPA